MNERMNKLINQCFVVTTDGKLSELNTVANVEKFAELLVGECIEVAYKAYFANPKTISAKQIEEKIRKHFGVNHES